MRIKEYREAKGITQKEMASILGIKQGSYSDKENGKRGFTVKEVLILEELLGASVSELFSDYKKEAQLKLKDK